MNKFYARQTEAFESNFEYWVEDYGTDFVISGNKNLCEHIKNDTFETVVNALDTCDIIGELEIFDTDKEDSVYTSHADIYSDFFETNINDEKATKIDKVILGYYDANIVTGRDTLVKIMSIITGDTWEHSEICGICQGDWNIIYYNADTLSDDDVEKIGIDYFNIGSAWVVGESEDDDEASYIYCYSWNDDGIKAEIANAFSDNDDCTIYLSRIEGFKSVAVYSDWI